MKTSMSIPPALIYFASPSLFSTCCDHLNQAQSGIIKGFSKLPKDVQDLIEWSGVEFIRERDSKPVIKIGVKISCELTIGSSSQVFIKPSGEFVVSDLETFTGSIEQHVEALFKETAILLIREIAINMKKKALFLETLARDTKLVN